MRLPLHTIFGFWPFTGLSAEALRRRTLGLEEAIEEGGAMTVGGAIIRWRIDWGLACAAMRRLTPAQRARIPEVWPPERVERVLAPLAAPVFTPAAPETPVLTLQRGRGPR